jgi:hypothetical protein
MFIYGAARRCPLSGGTQLVHPGKTMPQKRYTPSAREEKSAVNLDLFTSWPVRARSRP